MVTLCECGCGQPTKIARKAGGRGRPRTGQPNRFLKGHSSRKHTPYYVVDPTTGCWVWQRAFTGGGYGYVGVTDTTSRRAHRVFYEQANGPIPEGLHIDHLCRNRACVNPAHLEAVTPAENSRRGIHVKLSEADVRAIRASTEKHRVLAARYGVSIHTIRSVIYGKKWRDVEDVAA